jgi:hypothetical protein
MSTRTRLHSLFLTLLASPKFKHDLAVTYANTYSHSTALFTRGIGLSESAAYSLSVQFLNRKTFVTLLVAEHNLLPNLIRSLHTSFAAARKQKVFAQFDALSDRFQVDCSHHNMEKRRYAPIVSDLKCVLNVPNISKVFTHTVLPQWLECLRMMSFANPQKWIAHSRGHVAFEPTDWVNSFNLSIAVGNLFERIASLSLSDPTTVADYTYMLKTVLATLDSFQAELVATDFDPSKASEGQNNMPMSTIATSLSKSLTTMPCLSAAVSSPFSFHHVLHQFLAFCIREAALALPSFAPLLTPPNQNSSSTAPTTTAAASNQSFFSTFHLHLVEFPLMTLARSSQVKTAQWSRNGSNMLDQHWNYSEPPFCRLMRDSDLLTVAFGALSFIPDNKMCYFLNLVLHRFGMFTFYDLENAALHDPKSYCSELDLKFFAPLARPAPAEDNADDDDDDLSDDDDGFPMKDMHAPYLLPTPPKFTTAVTDKENVLMMEEMLYFLILLVTELPHPSIQASQPTSPAPPDHILKKLRREIVHRLASGPCTHSSLNEVHSMLSIYENGALAVAEKGAEESASTEHLDSILEQVANKKRGSGLEPDKYVLKDECWREYDPSFWHLSTKSHQSASENRALFYESEAKQRKERDQADVTKAWCPPPEPAHESFFPLRTHLLADATLIHVLWKLLHDHVGGSAALERQSETALARAIQLLTIGAHVFEDDEAECREWIEKMFLYVPSEGMSGTSPRGLSILLMLQVLHTQLTPPQVSSEPMTVFQAQDNALLSAAGWLCEFCCRFSEKATEMLGVSQQSAEDVATPNDNAESDMDRRKRMAKERVLRRMSESSFNFMAAMEVLGDESDEEQVFDAEKDEMATDEEAKVFSPEVLSMLTELPQCMICNEQGGVQGYCCLVQGSSVLMGGGFPRKNTHNVANNKMLGCHVSLCGHSVHSTCFDSYFADSVSNTAAASIGTDPESARGGFFCPLCKRLSNGLVPQVDAFKSWGKAKSHMKDKQASSQMLHLSLSESMDIAMSQEVVSMEVDTASLVHVNGNSLESWISSFVPISTAVPNSIRPTSEPATSIVHISRDWSSSLLDVRSKSDAASADGTANSGGLFERFLERLAEVSVRADCLRLSPAVLMSEFTTLSAASTSSAALSLGSTPFGSSLVALPLA